MQIAPERFYLGARAFYAVCWTLVVTVQLVYLVEVVKLDPLQMILVGTVLEAAVFLFEIPTGVVADVYSRKLSVVAGHALMGLGFLLVTLFPTFYGALLSSAVWGFGYTFISGAYAAWLTGEVGVKRANAAFLRGSQLGHGFGFIGIAAAVALAHISLALPIVLGSAGLFVLAAAMALWMRETNFSAANPDDRDSWQQLTGTFTEGLQFATKHRVLLLLLLTTAIYGIFSEGIDRLFTPLLINDYEFPTLGNLNSVTWWGIIAAIASLFGLVATTLARRYVKLGDRRQLSLVLATCLIGIGIGVLLIANLQGFYWLLAFYWFVGALRSAYGPLMTAWLNQLFPDETRATLFSLYGQADAVGQVVGGPWLGMLARSYSISLALTVSSFVLLPAAALYRYLASRNFETHSTKSR